LDCQVIDEKASRITARVIWQNASNHHSENLCLRVLRS
jgi:hypothetical protein